LDFTDLKICEDCIKEKKTEHTKKWATRSTQLLEIIHTNIYNPFDIAFFTKEKYFVTFTDGFLRYGFFYLLHEKSQAINAFEVFINKVERQLDKRVKN